MELKIRTVEITDGDIKGTATVVEQSLTTGYISDIEMTLPQSGSIYLGYCISWFGAQVNLDSPLDLQDICEQSKESGSCEDNCSDLCSCRQMLLNWNFRLAI